MEILYKALPTLEDHWPNPITLVYNKWLPINESGYKVLQDKHLLKNISPLMFGCISGGIKVDSGESLLVTQVKIIKKFDSWNFDSGESFVNDCLHRVIDTMGIAININFYKNWIENVKELSSRSAHLIASHKSQKYKYDSTEWENSYTDHFNDERCWQTKRLLQYLNGEVKNFTGIFYNKNKIDTW